MPKYLVTVLRRSVGTAEVEVEADNPWLAKEQALQEACSERDFNMFDPQYVIEDCSEKS